MTYNGHNVGSVLFADARLIFPKMHVQAPMENVLGRVRKACMLKERIEYAINNASGSVLFGVPGLLKLGVAVECVNRDSRAEALLDAFSVGGA